MSPRHVVVVGASLAGHSCVRALREAGYEGAVTVVGEEPHRPYDRPPLSKGFLDGTLAAADLALEDAEEDLGATTWLVGQRATALGEGHVWLEDGTCLVADAIVVATGSRARRLPAHLGGDLAGVHTVRTLDDAAALRADLVPGTRLVLVGAGFIGAEIAASAHHLGLDVSLVEAGTAPLAGPLGAELGAAVAGLHAAHGVQLHTGVPVAALTGHHGPGGRVDGVLLDDGTHLPADVVVAGIGSVPATGWLDGSGLALDPAGAVMAQPGGATNLPGVWAVGDCAAWWDADRGRHHRTEHWDDAMRRPRQVAADVLGLPAPATTSTPYFWSDQYGVRVQFAGTRHGDETVTIEAGGLTPDTVDGLLAVYWRHGVPTAVLGVGATRLFTRWKRGLGRAVAAA